MKENVKIDLKDAKLLSSILLEKLSFIAEQKKTLTGYKYSNNSVIRNEKELTKLNKELNQLDDDKEWAESAYCIFKGIECKLKESKN